MWDTVAVVAICDEGAFKVLAKPAITNAWMHCSASMASVICYMVAAGYYGSCIVKNYSCSVMQCSQQSSRDCAWPWICTGSNHWSTAITGPQTPPLYDVVGGNRAWHDLGIANSSPSALPLHPAAICLPSIVAAQHSAGSVVAMCRNVEVNISFLQQGINAENITRSLPLLAKWAAQCCWQWSVLRGNNVVLRATQHLTMFFDVALVRTHKHP